jgi:hypothetical protein
MQSEAWKKKALKVYYNQIKCLFCGLQGGIMKKMQEHEMLQLCLDQTEDNNYYHLFCAF